MQKDQHEWVKIFSTLQEHKASLVQLMLQEHEVDCVIMNKKDSAYGTFGEIELYTLSEQVVRALHLIKKHNE